MKANVTRSNARVGQPRLVIEATPEKVSLQFRCGKCQRPLPIDPDERLSVCVCRNTVAIADLLRMAEAMLAELRGAVCAIGGDDYFDQQEVVNATGNPDEPELEDPEDVENGGAADRQRRVEVCLALP